MALRTTQHTPRACFSNKKLDAWNHVSLHRVTWLPLCMLSPWSSASSGAVSPRSPPLPADSLPSPSLSWPPLSPASLSPSSADLACETFSSPDYGAWGGRTHTIIDTFWNQLLVDGQRLPTVPTVQQGAHNANHTGYIIMVVAMEHFEYLPHFFAYNTMHVLHTLYTTIILVERRGRGR